MLRKLLNFIRGVGSLLDMTPPPMPDAFKGKYLSDAEAMRSDWQAVGEDLSYAIQQADCKLLKRPGKAKAGK